ncbi:MAG: Endonuclease/exonuclease/phosphatase [Anaerocolumna sp.]|jgi:endonuclease/exonuclease/phosphatase family metal-dependent hydrolase|nr:Endonuclease/exonuclease/phosphatase [Anaerocolumna sp.]
MNMKSKIKIIGIIIGTLTVLVVAYVLYVFLTYERIEDNQNLEIGSKGTVTEEDISLNKEYSVLTYNIGFGAYSSDYSFFMDGGKYSRAYNRQAVVDNVKGSIETTQKQNVDFVLLQEVDLKSTRSYGVDENKMILDALNDYSSIFAVNYNSAYLMYPFIKPHGKSKSGMSIISKYQLTDAVRRSLPIDTSVYKLIDLDRCYTKSRIKVEDGKYLCLYNVHLSAYTKDERIVKNQITMLMEDIKEDYDSGNYIVCGGDFNQDLLGNSPALFGTPEIEDNWAKAFPADLLPSGISVVYDLLSDEMRAVLTPSCRNADIPYNPGISFVTTVDGFIISDNIELISVETIDNGFLYSDHNPVQMNFQLITK